jgi:hypothetical protein
MTITKKKELKFKQSETIVIKRSQINFAPYNPKRHSEESIKQQKKNFKQVGFLGGIVWNRTTCNLVSGHKRIMAMDLEYKYDGTTQTDYNIKVEAIELTEKQEKEQNIFMDAKSTNTPQDLTLLAEILPEIEIENTGLTDQDLNLISIEVPNFKFGNSDIITEAMQDTSKDYEDKKQKLIEVKKLLKGNVSNMRENSLQESKTYIILSFDSNDNKCEFMERFGYSSDQEIIKGELFADQIERIS